MTFQTETGRTTLRIASLAVPFLISGNYATAQFGGHSGDAVVYLLTASPAEPIQTGTVGATTDISRFRAIDPATLPVKQLVVQGTAFPFFTRTLFAEGNNLFEWITGEEGVAFQHRIYIAPVKVFQLDGIIAVPNGGGNSVASTYLSFPQNLDLDGETDLETRSMLVWSPHPAPIPFPTDVRGPVGPPNITGFQYLLSTPGLLKIPATMPWSLAEKIYPAAGWPVGIMLKQLDQDPLAGNTTNLFRMWPGTRTPSFQFKADTHLFVVQGSVTLMLAGGKTAVVPSGTYAFLPANVVISISNPTTYAGPVTTK